ncbi:MAG: hybrid sensor histidine kinase/response regulator transcription factor, partial [Bacteroides sp.]
TIRPDDETGILDQNISVAHNITLTASQSAFTLEFVVSNYISDQHNTFAYKLEGYDEEWYYLTDRREVSYSNLPQGTYTFLVKAANSDGKWNETATELKIVILPVWYKTWWAILLFLIASSALVIFIFRYFWMRKSMKAEIDMERIEKEKQEEISQMKMRFFINISHELRTPLTLILAPLHEVMQRVNDRWTRGQLEHIQRNANRLLHLVNQLMDYRRAELGVFELKVSKGNAHQQVLDTFLFYDKLAKHKNILYSFHSEIEDKEMLFDGNYLELIVNNLLSNAFKFTGEDGSITVSLNEENGNLIIKVSDTGIGIPENKKGKIFERFYQVESEHVGSGIGLSLVLRLVELHHGKIELNSEEGKGSTFTVSIPQNEAIYKPTELKSTNEKEIAEENVHSTNSKEMYFLDTEKEKEEEEITEETGKKKRGTLLIVEDNIEILQYLSEGLADKYTIFRAGNGEEALEKMKDNEVDIVLTDVMMPVMDGIKLCKQIKQNIRTCHIPVIILSAKTDIKDQMEGLQVGADDYIAKPFSLLIVTVKIQNMIRTRRRIFEHYSKSLEVEPEKITFNAMDEELLSKAVAIVEKNMDNIEFSTDEFAKEMNMSRSNLHLKLKAITGESSIDFIRKLKFNKACKLLAEGRYTISEVSTMVGFNTPSYFATSFKKYFGCLPTEYIKNRRI